MEKVSRHYVVYLFVKQMKYNRKLGDMKCIQAEIPPSILCSQVADEKRSSLIPVKRKFNLSV